MMIEFWHVLMMNVFERISILSNYSIRKASTDLYQIHTFKNRPCFPSRVTSFPWTFSSTIACSDSNETGWQSQGTSRNVAKMLALPSSGCPKRRFNATSMTHHVQMLLAWRRNGVERRGICLPKLWGSTVCWRHADIGIMAQEVKCHLL